MLTRPYNRKLANTTYPCGGVAEWLNAPVLKTGVHGSVPGVRIPPPPPFWKLSRNIILGYISADTIGRLIKISFSYQEPVYKFGRMCALISLPRADREPLAWQA